MSAHRNILDQKIKVHRFNAWISLLIILLLNGTALVSLKLKSEKQ